MAGKERNCDEKVRVGMNIYRQNPRIFHLLLLHALFYCIDGKFVAVFLYVHRSAEESGQWVAAAALHTICGGA